MPSFFNILTSAKKATFLPSADAKNRVYVHSMPYYLVVEQLYFKQSKIVYAGGFPEQLGPYAATCKPEQAS